MLPWIAARNAPSASMLIYGQLMSTQPEQSYAKHAKMDPLFHYILIPLFGVNFLLSLANAFRNPNFPTIWAAILSLGAVMAVFMVRIYSLKVQNRVIRLEERLRLATLLPDRLRSRIPELTEAQLIALRFASDAELPQLTEQALQENLPLKEIKKRIQHWRPDHYRV